MPVLDELIRRHGFVAAEVTVVEWQMTVIDLEGKQRQGSCHQAAARPAVGVSRRRPASFEVRLLRIRALVLLGDQQVAHFGVPSLPIWTAEVVKDLCSVVVVIGAVDGARRGLLQRVYATDDPAVAGASAQI